MRVTRGWLTRGVTLLGEARGGIEAQAQQLCDGCI